MGLITGIFKWLFPEGIKSAHDYKLVFVVLAGCMTTFYFAGLMADESVEESEKRIQKEIEIKVIELSAKMKVKENQINNMLTSQHTIVVQALKNITDNQKEIKEKLKVQDTRLYNLQMQVRRSQ